MKINTFFIILGLIFAILVACTFSSYGDGALLIETLSNTKNIPIPPLHVDVVHDTLHDNLIDPYSKIHIIYNFFNDDKYKAIIDNNNSASNKLPDEKTLGSLTKLQQFIDPYISSRPKIDLVDSLLKDPNLDANQKKFLITGISQYKVAQGSSKEIYQQVLLMVKNSPSMTPEEFVNTLSKMHGTHKHSRHKERKGKG